MSPATAETPDIAIENPIQEIPATSVEPVLTRDRVVAALQLLLAARREARLRGM